jgi:hypothetical protein
LLLFSGFEFPFKERLLVPAVPLFVQRDFAEPEDVRLGRTESHVVIRIGPWTVWLAIDSSARYPEVRQVVPRSPKSLLRLDEDDRAVLLEAIRSAPKCLEGTSAATVTLGSRPSVRWRSGEKGAVNDAVISRSAGSGPPLEITVDLRYLERALALGFAEVRAADASAPVVFGDGRRTLVISCARGRFAGAGGTAPFFSKPKSTCP